MAFPLFYWVQNNFVIFIYTNMIKITTSANNTITISDTDLLTSFILLYSDCDVKVFNDIDSNDTSLSTRYLIISNKFTGKIITKVSKYNLDPTSSNYSSNMDTYATSINSIIASASASSGGSTSGVTLTGDVTGTGTSSIVTTLATQGGLSAGTYNRVTVNTKGLVTAASNLSNASASTTGLLSNTDWTTFNNKMSGGGTSGQIAYFNGSNSINSSSNFVFDSTNGFLGIGGTPLSKLYLSGNASSTAWNTNGIGLRFAPTTFTDTTSIGAVTTMYFNTFGSPTLNTSSVSTVNVASNVFIDAPIAGTNATLTNIFALALGGSIRLSGTGPTITSTTNLNIQSASTANSLTLQQGGNTRYQISTTGAHNWAGTTQSSGIIAFWTITQPVYTGGSFPGLLWSAGAHVGQTASTELTDINFNLARNIAFATGAITTQRAFRIQAPTYAFVSSSTISTAVTLEVDSPVAGSNGTITSNYAIRANGNIALSTAGNKIFIKEGSNGSVGQIALVAGTRSITISGLTTSSRAFVQLVSPSGTSLTTQYQAVCTANTLTIQANVAAGTINTSDVSTLNYIIIEPA